MRHEPDGNGRRRRARPSRHVRRPVYRFGGGYRQARVERVPFITPHVPAAGIREWIVISPTREIAVSWSSLCMGNVRGSAEYKRKRETTNASARARRRDA
jgi:hypothetical protein